MDQDKSAQENNKSFYYQGEAKFSPVPLTVSSPVIKPIDRNKLRANAVESMHLQANQQITLLRKQAELIMQQVKEIEERLKISELIYTAEMKFKPVMGQTYHLYQKEDDSFLVSMIGPLEWGRSKKFKQFISSVKLLADHTWEILDKNALNFDDFVEATPSDQDV